MKENIKAYGKFLNTVLVLVRDWKSYNNIITIQNQRTRPLGHALRQQFLLLMLRDSRHTRTQRKIISLKVFLSPPHWLNSIKVTHHYSTYANIQRYWQYTANRMWLYILQLIQGKWISDHKYRTGRK